MSEFNLMDNSLEEMRRIVDSLLTGYVMTPAQIVSEWSADERRYPNGKTVTVYKLRGTPIFYTVIWFNNNNVEWLVSGGVPSDGVVEGVDD